MDSEDRRQTQEETISSSGNIRTTALKSSGEGFESQPKGRSLPVGIPEQGGPYSLND